eukprot:GHVT01102845.1.p2 GENE.GHVT01102845.1~~GHVT01102845.1.p2  ORF type:complete len:189 (-),score=32.29 GHVT01102845.1:363-929(-)
MPVETLGQSGAETRNSTTAKSSDCQRPALLSACPRPAVAKLRHAQKPLILFPVVNLTVCFFEVAAASRVREKGNARQLHHGEHDRHRDEEMWHAPEQPWVVEISFSRFYFRDELRPVRVNKVLLQRNEECRGQTSAEKDDARDLSFVPPVPSQRRGERGGVADTTAHAREEAVEDAATPRRRQNSKNG